MIAALHDGILAALNAQFSGRVETIETYRPTEIGSINTPALLLEMEEAFKPPKIGNAKKPLQCRMTIHCLLSFQTENVFVAVREFASEVYQLVDTNTWGLGEDARMPEQIELGPGMYKPGQSGFESWYVTWEQVIFF